MGKLQRCQLRIAYRIINRDAFRIIKWLGLDVDIDRYLLPAIRPGFFSRRVIKEQLEVIQGLPALGADRI